MRSSASSCCEADSGLQPHAASMPTDWSREAREGSATSTLSPRSCTAPLVGRSAAGACFSNGMRNQKLCPAPGSKSVPTSPPISSTSRRATLSVSDAPSILPPGVASPSRKCWNAGMKCGSGPSVPACATVNLRATRTSSSSARSMRTRPPPWRIVRTIVRPRLSSTWRRRPGSPRSSEGTSWCTMQAKSSPFSAACGSSSAATSSAVTRRSKSRVSRSSFSDWILEKSIVSVTSPSSERAEFWITSIHWRWSSPSSVPSRSLVMLSSPFIGWRSSRPMVETMSGFVVPSPPAWATTSESLVSVSIESGSSSPSAITSTVRAVPT